MTNKEHEIFMRKLFDEKLEDAFDRGCVNMVQKLTEYFTKYGITLNVNNWMNDYNQGYDTAKDDIKDFCRKEIVRSEHNDDMRDMYYTGYRYGLCKVLEYIEGM